MITDEQIARIKNQMSKVGSDLNQLKSALETHQAKVRKTLMRLGDELDDE